MNVTIEAINCFNANGSYNCTCKEGYTGDGQSCQGEKE